MLKKILRSLWMDYILAAVLTTAVFWPVTVYIVDFFWFAFKDQTLTGFNWAMYLLLLVYIPLSAKLIDPIVKRYLAWIRSP